MCGCWSGFTSEVRASKLIELAVVVERRGPRPRFAHDVEVLVGAAVARVVVEEVAVALLLGVVAAGDDVDGYATVAELVQRGRLARGQRRRDEAGPVRDQKAEPVGHAS